MRRLLPDSAWSRIAREPLLHFALLGVALFAMDAVGGAARGARSSGQQPLTTQGAAPRDEQPQGHTPIVVDAAARTRITAEAADRLGRPPTAAEVASETDHWIGTEVLYREGRRRGLERDDPMIRKRIASRMRFVLEQSVIVPEPSEAELRTWFAAHHQRWATPERVSFRHVFIKGSGAPARQRAASLATALGAGAAPHRLGDRFPGGHRYRGRRVAQLARAFGAYFVTGLASQQAGMWVQRRSRFGLHLVQLEAVEPGRPALFEAARMDVRKAWRDDNRRRGVESALRRLRDAWKVEHQ